MTSAPGPFNLAASWYVAMTAHALKNKPRAVELFGRRLVAWRDRVGRPVLMARECPHMGASLADGRIVGGCLQCPFHHWRFDASGTCVEIPGSTRIVAAAHRSVYPTLERYGYVWAWYGSAEPMFGLPEMPALAAGRPDYRGFRFADVARATVRRIMENTYDPDHLVALHGLSVAGPLTLRTLTDPAETSGHGPPIAREAWFGAGLSWPRYTGGLGTITGLLGTNAERFILRVDGWPAGQRISYFADGVQQYQLLLAATPHAPHQTIQHIAVAVERTGRFWRDLKAYLANRAEIQVASNQDLPIFNTIEPGDRHGIYVAGDHGVLRFRKFYQSWVHRVAADA